MDRAIAGFDEFKGTQCMRKTPRKAIFGRAVLALCVMGCVAMTQSARAANAVPVSDNKVHDALKAGDARHTEIFKKFGAAVVGITCRGTSPVGNGDGFTGTGAVISPDGWIVSNIT